MAYPLENHPQQLLAYADQWVINIFYRADIPKVRLPFPRKADAATLLP